MLKQSSRKLEPGCISKKRLSKTMPNKIAIEVLNRLTALEKAFKIHLVDGTAETRVLQNDMKWIKWLVTGIAGGIGAIVVSLLVYAIKN